MRAAIMNLLENSWKFTRKHATTRIEFGEMDGPDGPIYFLRDDGAGFDMADAARLFSPFQRLHKATGFRRHRHRACDGGADHSQARRPDLGGGGD